MTRAILLVGTAKGAFFVESDAERRAWDIRGPLCEGWPIHDLIVEPGSGAILAGGGSPWYGPAVWRSEDLGASWTHSSDGLTYGDGAAGDPVATVWSLATAPDGTILAGVEPAGLFRSADRGATWEHVRGLTEHESRPTWEPGAGGLILHTIVPHPTDAARTWVGISAVGVFESRDGGATWEPRNSGVRADFNPDPYPVTGQCVHKFAMAAGEPETLYQQNHCGMYRSTDGGLTWTDLSANGLPSDFGFPLVSPSPRSEDVLDHPAQRRRPRAVRARGVRCRLEDRGPRRHLAAQRRWAAAARRVHLGAPRGDGPRHARPGRGRVRHEVRPAVAQPRRGPVVGADHGGSPGDLGGRIPGGRLTGPGMATVLLPRSLLELFPGVERRQLVDGATVDAVVRGLDARVPGMRDRLVEAGPRLRPHINVFVAGEPADLDTPVAPDDTVHVIPAVSGG